MSGKLLRLTALRWAYILAIQIFLLNNVLLGTYLNPYFYVLIVILFPLRINPISSLLIAFITGLLVDLMMSTAGIHAAALTATAYLRIGLGNRIQRRNSDLQVVSIAEMGFSNFMVYAAILCFVHHSLLFILDSFRSDEIFFMMGRSLVSASLSMILILLHELFSQSGRRHVL